MKMKLMLAMMSTVALALWSLPASAAAGAVYTMNNASAGNAVIMFNRAASGELTAAGTFSTGGKGSGAGLGSQGALALNASNRFLFAVNAGSNSVSSFVVTANGLSLIGTADSGGKNPISLTSFGNRLYVLNDGGAVGSIDTIAGFRVDAGGHLAMMSHGTRLSAPSVGPAEISFNPEGNELVVTEKGTNKIDIFSLDDEGLPVGRRVIASAAETPYGFAFGKRDELFVSDAFGGGAGAGAVSSYYVPSDGAVRTLDAMAPDGQSAPCWVAVSSDGRFAYTTNTGSGTVSGYAVGYTGQLQLLNPNGITADLGGSSSPIDLAFSNDARFLYVLGPGTGIIDGFGVAASGALTMGTQATGLPGSTSGLAVR
ncbi:MAG: lactonase family protein [Terriglobales bacterium]